MEYLLSNQDIASNSGKEALKIKNELNADKIGEK